MGEMKVEHVLLFLVGAFLLYHMMGKCRSFEGYTNPCGTGYCPGYKHWWSDNLECIKC